MAPAKKGSADLSRRAFLVRMAALGFGVPIISSFSLDAVAHAFEQPLIGNQALPNQMYPNQTFFPAAPTQSNPNQFFGNQGLPPPSEFFENQATASEFPNQYLSNQYATGTYTPNQFTP